MDNLGVQTILAVAAGFLLNLTPCVLTAIPLKVSAILRKTGSAKRERSLAALSFFTGCLGFFVVVLFQGMLAKLPRGGDPGILRNPGGAFVFPAGSGWDPNCRATRIG